MKYILFFILFAEIFASNPIKPKLCKDCKFFRKDFFTINKFGKCSLFPKGQDNIYSLVDGSKNNNVVDYYYCSVARNYKYMCGSEGTLYVKK